MPHNEPTAPEQTTNRHHRVDAPAVNVGGVARRAAIPAEQETNRQIPVMQVTGIELAWSIVRVSRNLREGTCAPMNFGA
jgi:hypothetical protein